MAKMYEYLIAEDKKSLTDAQKEAYDRDVKALEKFQTREFLPQMLKNLLPWYNPGRKRVPEGLFEYLALYEKPEPVAAA